MFSWREILAIEIIYGIALARHRSLVHAYSKNKPYMKLGLLAYRFARVDGVEGEAQRGGNGAGPDGFTWAVDFQTADGFGAAWP